VEGGAGESTDYGHLVTGKQHGWKLLRHKEAPQSVQQRLSARLLHHGMGIGGYRGKGTIVRVGGIGIHAQEGKARRRHASLHNSKRQDGRIHVWCAEREEGEAQCRTRRVSARTLCGT
jgi:hypothetical protein